MPGGVQSGRRPRGGHRVRRGQRHSGSREKPRGVQDSVPGPCKEGLITNAKLQWLREGEAMEALNKEPVSKNFDAGEGSSVTAGGAGSRGAVGFFPITSNVPNNILTLKDQTTS